MTTEELEKIQEIIQEELNNLEIDTGVDPTERLEDIERRIVAINDKLDIILGILCEEKE
jgi:cell division GTPase FtsZ